MLFSISAVNQQSFSEMATTNQQNSRITETPQKMEGFFFLIKLDFWKHPIDWNMSENSSDFLFHFSFFFSQHFQTHNLAQL